MTTFIAIVGGGPKGTYGVERLAAQLAADPPAEPVEIHIFNRTPHVGAGDIYDPGQPDYLLINYAIGNIDMWIDEAPPAVVPHPRPLTAWLREVQGLGVADSDFASRATVGRYLAAGFDAIVEHLPPGVTARCRVGEVVDLWQEGEAYRLALRRAGATAPLPHRYRHVLLATGHPHNPPDPTYRAFAARHFDTHFVPFIYPVEPALTSLPGGERVAVKGLGLTFIDAVLALTEGRGGHFTQGEAGLEYHPSGREPSAICPFSRSGLPMLPRGPHDGSAPFPLRFFTEEMLPLAGRPYDFEADLWPLLRQELTLAYYRVMLRNHGLPLSEVSSYEALESQIDAFHRTHDAPCFDPSRFLDPLAGEPSRPPEAQHRFVLHYLRDGIAAARAGEACDPRAAVTAVWRLALPLFRRLFEFGGLTAASHERFMERYVGPLSRVTFGPPIESAEKIVALAEAGLLRFDLSRGPRVRLDMTSGYFCVENEQAAARARILIDARIPKVSLDANHSPLFRHMVRRGLARPFVNTAGGATYPTGGLALSRRGMVLDAQGQPTRIAMTGTPTEGVVFDNDSLSRHCNNFVSDWAARVRTELTNG